MEQDFNVCRCVGEGMWGTTVVGIQVGASDPSRIVAPRHVQHSDEVSSGHTSGVELPHFPSLRGSSDQDEIDFEYWGYFEGKRKWEHEIDDSAKCCSTVCQNSHFLGGQGGALLNTTVTALQRSIRPLPSPPAGIPSFRQ